MKESVPEFLDYAASLEPSLFDKRDVDLFLESDWYDDDAPDLYMLRAFEWWYERERTRPRWESR